jgi:hypothetical protein
MRRRVAIWTTKFRFSLAHPGRAIYQKQPIAFLAAIRTPVSAVV